MAILGGRKDFGKLNEKIVKRYKVKSNAYVMAGLMLLCMLSTVVVVDSAVATHPSSFGNNGNSTFYDANPKPGHELNNTTTSTIPTPSDFEFGSGPCGYSMNLVSDANTWWVEGNQPATIQTQQTINTHGSWVSTITANPSGMTGDWIWSPTNQPPTTFEPHTLVRPVMLPVDAYNIEARFQFAVDDYYTLYVQNGVGASSLKVKSDGGSGLMSSVTDLWIDDITPGLNYFIWEIDNVELEPHTGGLIYAIHIQYCLPVTPTGPCPDGGPRTTDFYYSDNETLVRDAGSNDPWSTPTIIGSQTSNAVHSSWGNLGAPAEHIWPMVPNVNLDFENSMHDEYQQGNFEFKREFIVPAHAVDVEADFNGVSDDRFHYTSYNQLDFTAAGSQASIVILNNGLSAPIAPDWVMDYDGIDDGTSNAGNQHDEDLPDSGHYPVEYDLIITNRNRMSTGGGVQPTVGMIQYILEVSYCIDVPPPTNECEPGNPDYVEAEFFSDIGQVKYTDSSQFPNTWDFVYDDFSTNSVTWADVTYPMFGQDSAWASPTAGSEYVWVGTDSNGDGVAENRRGGTFMFRHDFTVPSNAHTFNFEFNGTVDNQFQNDPAMTDRGFNSGWDLSIRAQQLIDSSVTWDSNLIKDFLNPPTITSAIGSPLAGSGSIQNHHNDASNSKIPDIAFLQVADFGGEEDLSLVIFARNRNKTSDGSATAGGIAYSLKISYCSEDTSETVLPDSDWETYPKNTCQKINQKWNSGFTFWSDDNTYYLESGDWEPTQIVTGSSYTGGASAWPAGNMKWNNGVYPVTGNSLPPGAVDSEWIWNASYAKAYGMHHFTRGFQLPSNTINAFAHIAYSTDDMLTSAWISDSTGGIDYTPGGLEDPSAPSHQFKSIFNTGGQSATGSSTYVQLGNGAQVPMAGDTLYLNIDAKDTQTNNHPPPTYDGVDPAGLRYVVQVCLEVKTPPPPPPQNCSDLGWNQVDRVILSGQPVPPNGTNTEHLLPGSTTWVSTPLRGGNGAPNNQWISTWPDMNALWVWPSGSPTSYLNQNGDLSGVVLEMRTDFTVPADAQLIELEFWGYADNRFVGDVLVGPDQSLTSLGSQVLAIPPVGDHHVHVGDIVSGGPISLPTFSTTSAQNFEVSWAISNRNQTNGDTTPGGVVWGMNLSYCDPPIVEVVRDINTDDSDSENYNVEITGAGDAADLAVVGGGALLSGLGLASWLRRGGGGGNLAKNEKLP